jgi:hypothetical protein
MKIKILLTFALVATLSAIGLCQSVVITGNNVTYDRPKPSAEYKKSFTINYPKVKAATPALSKKIESAISYGRVLGLKLKEEMDEFQWLEGADYEVGYNDKYILSISLSMEGSAAYPSGVTKNVVVDLHSGLRVKPVDLFTNLPGLLARVRRMMNKEVARSIVEIRKDPENNEPHPEEIFKEQAKYHPLSLNEFVVSDKGVTFIHDYGFPHVIQALQPDGGFFFSWAQLKPYIKRGGLLGQFVR